jgi:hypothetical protein
MLMFSKIASTSLNSCFNIINYHPEIFPKHTIYIFVY